MPIIYTQTGSSIPVIGNGQDMGLTNGNGLICGVCTGVNPGRLYPDSNGGAGHTLPYYNGSFDSDYGNGVHLGLVTDSNISGIIADLSYNKSKCIIKI